MLLIGGIFVDGHRKLWSKTFCVACYIEMGSVLLEHPWFLVRLSFLTMEMMMNKAAIALALSMALMSGCGSDNDNRVDEPNTPDVPDAGQSPQTGSGVFGNVWGPDVKWQLEGPITIYLDKMDRADWVAQTEGRYSDIKHGFTVDAEDVRKVISKPLRDDIFNDGQITFADILLYLSEARDDFHVEYEWGEDIGAYRYTVWRNEDGSAIEFDEVGKPLGQGDPNWYASWINDTGEFKREFNYTNWGELLSTRLELTVLQNESGVLLRSYSDAYTYRREEMQRAQAERRKTSENKFSDNRVIVPSVMIQPIGGDRVVFKNVEVRPHNLRPDIYKKDAMITLADVYLSMREQGLIDVGFSFWGKLSTGVDIQHFVVNSVNGVVNQGRLAYAIDASETKYKSDVMHKYGLGQMGPGSTVLSTFCDGIGLNGKPSGIPDGIIDDECEKYFSEKGLEIDISDWYGDRNKHIFSDVWPMYYPVDSAALVNKKLSFFYTEEAERLGGDGQYPIYDIEAAIAPLTNKHFGWGIADCGTCHSLQGIHSNNDQGSLGVNPKPVDVLDLGRGIQSYEVTEGIEAVVAPYQCAQCHGSNGAPSGHGAVGTCFWCHDNDFEPKNHGTVHKRFNKMYEGAAAEGSTAIYPAEPLIDVPSVDREAVSKLSADRYGDPNYLLNVLPAKENQSFVYMHGLYSGDMKVRGNSDWSTDPVYPDPYSCMTCHPNK